MTHTPDFVNSLRVRPQIIRLAGAQAAETWTVRVQAADVWDAVRVIVTPDMRLGDVKQAGMADLLPDIEATDTYMVKVHGAEVHNEELPLRAAGVLDGTTLFLTGRRRRPVR